MKFLSRISIFVASILLAYLSVIGILAIMYGEHVCDDDDDYRDGDGYREGDGDDDDYREGDGDDDA